MSLDPINLYGEVTLLSLLSTEEIPLPKAIGTASHLNELKVCKMHIHMYILCNNHAGKCVCTYVLFLNTSHKLYIINNIVSFLYSHNTLG